MPSALTYPGVYIEEISSGVRTITGVATSITAFLGRAICGAVNEPTTINSYGGFERQFGGLGIGYPMSYAIRDFFLNGGSTAIIVRVLHPNTDAEIQATLAVIAAAKSIATAAAAAAQSVATAAASATTPADAKTAANAASKTIQDDTHKTTAEKEAAKAVADAVTTAATPSAATINDVKQAANDALNKVLTDALPTPLPSKAI